MRQFKAILTLSAFGLLSGLAMLGTPGPIVAIAAEAPPADTAAPTPDAATLKAPAADDSDDDDANTKPKSPEEKMQARFPQPIRVGDLIGQPILDRGHSTIGYVQRVVRTKDDKIELIVPYRPWLGWAKFLKYDERPVAVPIEAVGSMGPALSSIDMSSEAYDAAPTWVAGTDRDIPSDETIKIALARE